MKLKKYLIYKHQTFPQIKIILDAFSFPAAIFGGFWLMYHRIWAFLLLIPVKMLIGSFMMHIMSCMFLGFFAADILEWHYKRRGYTIYDIIFAYSESEAEMKIYSKLGGQNV